MTISLTNPIAHTTDSFLAAFPGAANLRNNLEAYLAARVAALGGNVT